MPTGYERSVFPYRVYAERKVERPPEAAQGLPSDVRAGQACPRVGCGGLLVWRPVETLDGGTEEVVCTACSRSRLIRILEPYKAMAAGDPKMNGLLREKGRTEGRGDGTGEDLPLPAEVRGEVLLMD